MIETHRLKNVVIFFQTILSFVQSRRVIYIYILLTKLFSSGTFPNNLEIANAIPMFKKDDHTIFSNYCLISLQFHFTFTFISSKINEKRIHTQLTMFLNKNNTLHERQFGF